MDCDIGNPHGRDSRRASTNRLVVVLREELTMSKGVVVLLSGGLDSAVALFHCVQSDSPDYDDVHALSFQYGQRHQAELNRASQMARAAGLPEGRHTILELPPFPVWSALTHGGTLDAITDMNPDVPASFVPGRNLMFVTLAAMYGYDRGLQTVVIGANEVDYSGYPDCRNTALRSMELAVRRSFDWSEFKLGRPLIDMSKAEIWAKADRMGILELVRTGTLSCYKGDQTEHLWGFGCGECPSCLLRAGGWFEFQRAQQRRNPLEAMELGGLG